MMEEINNCRCGNELISVIETIGGTQIYCSKCGRSTKRHDRAHAIKIWNARYERRQKR